MLFLNGDGMQQISTSGGSSFLFGNNFNFQNQFNDGNDAPTEANN